jgi:hypothetical protein
MSYVQGTRVVQLLLKTMENMIHFKNCQILYLLVAKVRERLAVSKP